MPKKGSDAPRRRPGRPSLPPDSRRVYVRRPLSLTREQWDNLEKLARRLHIASRTGTNYGNPSWRTMFAILADKAPEILKAIDEEEAKRHAELKGKRKQSELSTIPIRRGISLQVDPAQFQEKDESSPTD